MAGFFIDQYLSFTYHPYRTSVGDLYAMSQKILALVTACKSCPNYHYDSGGRYKCGLADEHIIDANRVASFCPLADFPSRTIAQLERTVFALQNPGQYGFEYMLLAHCATKLRALFSSDGSSLQIPLRDETFVSLRFDHITKVETYPATLYFNHDDSQYKLHPDTDPPKLYTRYVRDDIDELRGREMWRDVHLKL